MIFRIKLSLVLERDAQMKERTGILDVYFPRLQMFYSMKSFDVKYASFLESKRLHSTF